MFVSPFYPLIYSNRPVIYPIYYPFPYLAGRFNYWRFGRGRRFLWNWGYYPFRWNWYPWFY